MLSRYVRMASEIVIMIARDARAPSEGGSYRAGNVSPGACRKVKNANQRPSRIHRPRSSVDGPDRQYSQSQKSTVCTSFFPTRQIPREGTLLAYHNYYSQSVRQHRARVPSREGAANSYEHLTDGRGGDLAHLCLERANSLGERTRC